MAQDRKFKWNGYAFENRVSGEIIPDDEPVIIFRARDIHALDVLEYYLSRANDPHHRLAIEDRIADFRVWRNNHADRMKEPGITGDMRLNRDDFGEPPCDSGRMGI